MSLINCNRKNTCGPLLSSSCVDYNGPLDEIVITDDELCCNPSIDDVFVLISKKIQSVLDKIDLSEFNKSCLTFDRATQDPKELWQEQTNILCEVKSGLATLKTKVDGLNASNLNVTIDLGCLTSPASLCVISPQTYTIYSILNLFKNEICSLKNP